MPSHYDCINYPVCKEGHGNEVPRATPLLFLGRLLFKTLLLDKILVSQMPITTESRWILEYLFLTWCSGCNFMTFFYW